MIHVNTAVHDQCLSSILLSEMMATRCGLSRLHCDLYIFAWSYIKIINITLQCIVNAI